MYAKYTTGRKFNFVIIRLKKKNKKQQNLVKIPQLQVTNIQG